MKEIYMKHYQGDVVLYMGEARAPGDHDTKMAAYKKDGIIYMMNYETFFQGKVTIDGGEVKIFSNYDPLKNLYLGIQQYKHIPLRLLQRTDYAKKKAKHFSINDTTESTWIPNVYLTPEGQIRDGVDLDFVFQPIPKKLHDAGVGPL